MVLFRLNEYEKCLSDISAALHFGYPDNLQYKLFERRGACQQALGYVSAFLHTIDQMFKIYCLIGAIVKPRRAMKRPSSSLKSEKLLRINDKRFNQT